MRWRNRTNDTASACPIAASANPASCSASTAQHAHRVHVPAGPGSGTCAKPSPTQRSHTPRHTTGSAQSDPGRHALAHADINDAVTHPEPGSTGPPPGTASFSAPSAPNTAPGPTEPRPCTGSRRRTGSAGPKISADPAAGTVPSS